MDSIPLVNRVRPQFVNGRIDRCVITQSYVDIGLFFAVE